MTVGDDDLARLDAWWAELTPTERLAVRSADGHSREGWICTIVERSGYPCEPMWTPIEPGEEALGWVFPDAITAYLATPATVDHPRDGPGNLSRDWR
jgi:hypothetical protein